MRKTGSINKGGFTLAEAMMAIVVLTIASAGVILPFTSGASVRAEGMRRTLAANLASDLIERIVDTEFDQIISTYDGYTEAQGQVKGVDGAVITDPAYAKLSRKVSCQNVYMPQESEAVASKFILVTVSVYYDSKETAVLSRLITR